MSTPIPDKRYFKIGEVAGIVGVQPHVLRYWEKELPFVRPDKTASNQRRFRRKDVETLVEVERLLREESYTLAGVRKRMSRRGGSRPSASVSAVVDDVVESSPSVPQSVQVSVTPNDSQDLGSDYLLTRQLGLDFADRHLCRQHLQAALASARELLALVAD